MSSLRLHFGLGRGGVVLYYSTCDCRRMDSERHELPCVELVQRITSKIMRRTGIAIGVGLLFFHGVLLHMVSTQDYAHALSSPNMTPQHT